MMERLSSRLLEELRRNAEASPRSEVRLATIRRLVEACDALEGGSAVSTLRAAFGEGAGIAAHQRITPSNVERYVRARQKSDSTWTGPSRVSLQRDQQLNAYVTAREDERLKPDKPKHLSDRRKRIEDALSKVQDMDLRMELRFTLEEGRRAQRQLSILSSGLRKLPGIDVDALIDGRTSAPAAGKGASPLSPGDRDVLKGLVQRLRDPAEMSRMGFSVDGDRIRHDTPPGPSLVRPAEMRLLMLLCDYVDVSGPSAG